MPSSRALIDTGPLIAFYNQRDKHHAQICEYFKTCTYYLVTTDECIAEVMYALSSSKVQSSFSKDIGQRVWQREALQDSDFKRSAELLINTALFLPRLCKPISCCYLRVFE